MHVDKSRTHVISCILHVDHSEDSEPWPILIEDFQGNTNEVVLESGDLMFYESSKCIHGRPHKFNGSWCTYVMVAIYTFLLLNKMRRCLPSFVFLPYIIYQHPPPPAADGFLYQTLRFLFTISQQGGIRSRLNLISIMPFLLIGIRQYLQTLIWRNLLW